MIKCPCGFEIGQYRLTGIMISKSKQDREDYLTKGPTIPLRVGSDFYAAAMVVCPECGQITFHDLGAKGLSGMTELTDI